MQWYGVLGEKTRQFTLPKTNSSPLKIDWVPKGKANVFHQHELVTSNIPKVVKTPYFFHQQYLILFMGRCKQTSPKFFFQKGTLLTCGFLNFELPIAPPRKGWYFKAADGRIG